MHTWPSVLHMLSKLNFQIRQSITEMRCFFANTNRITQMTLERNH